MNRKTTCLARAVKCGFFGVRGWAASFGVSAALVCPAKKPSLESKAAIKRVVTGQGSVGDWAHALSRAIPAELYGMTLGQVRLVRKTGGRSGTFVRPGER